MANLISLNFHFGKSPAAYLSTVICLKRSTLIHVVLHVLLSVEKYEMYEDEELVSKVYTGPKRINGI